MNIDKRKSFDLKQENLPHPFTLNNICFNLAITSVQPCSFILNNTSHLLKLCTIVLLGHLSFENYVGEISRKFLNVKGEILQHNKCQHTN